MFHTEKITVSSSNSTQLEIVKVTTTEAIKVADITINPRTCIVRPNAVDHLQSILAFGVKEDDVWILTYPKCGTTWTQEMCWLILNNYDFDTAKKLDLSYRSPFLEGPKVLPGFTHDSWKVIKDLKTPRLIKSHLPLPLLPRQLWIKNPKIIYVTRDPRDAAISHYNHMNDWLGLSCSKEDSLEFFLKGYCTFGSYWDHVFDFWKLRNQSNILFLTYEDMKRDLRAVIKKICSFLNKSINEDQMVKMLDHLSFENMSKNKACQHEVERNSIAAARKSEKFKFMRRGKVGAYKDEFPLEFIEKFDLWIKENIKGTDFHLYSPTT